MRQEGFTLLELLAVMALLAIACTLLVSAVSLGMGRNAERQATADLLQALRQARVQAQVEQQTVGVYFDLANRCYRLSVKPPRCLPNSVQLIVHTAAQYVAREAAIMFYPDGSSSGGNVRLKTSTQETSIDISWLTGTSKLGRAQP